MYKSPFRWILFGCGIAFLIFLMVSFRHPFYLGVTEILYKQNSSIIELNARVFTDDLEASLRKQFNLNINLTASTNQETTDSLVRLYALQHLGLTVNQNTLPLLFQGYELHEDATWIYFDAHCSHIPISVNVKNSLLFDRLKEQSHILHFTIGTYKKSHKLEYPDSSYTLQVKTN